jgi:redox-sensitive bicupin YhaK (pirin superfamily)
MRTPWYADIPAAAIPNVAVGEGATAKLIAGSWNDKKGAGPDRPTEPFITDIDLKAGATTDIPIPSGHNAFAFVFQGAAKVGPQTMPRELVKGDLAVLTDQGSLTATATKDARILIVAAKPLREPIAKYGPFVMNTQDELRQAFSDFQQGRF